MTHTPGPWHVEPDGSIVDRDGCDVIASHADAEGGHYLAATEEDRSLIAAAPDLLQGLEDMIGHCRGCDGKGRCYGPVPGRPGSYAPDQPCQDCSDARAAIKKARGEP